MKIQYGAAIMFSDGSISTAAQKKALEYGCTLDPVTQLAPLIEQKVKQEIVSNDDDAKIKPMLLVQADQFGIAHAPFAKGRAFLTEHGHGDCSVLIHNNDCFDFIEVKAHELVPSAPNMEGGLLLSDT